MYLDLLNFIQELIGLYSPITYQISEHYVDASGVDQILTYDVIPDGIAGVNFEYIMMCIILLGILIIFRDVFFIAMKFMRGKEKR